VPQKYLERKKESVFHFTRVLPLLKLRVFCKAFQRLFVRLFNVFLVPLFFKKGCFWYRFFLKSGVCKIDFFRLK
jgi:hypothetical protein